jgi:hypothetical protein
MKQIKNAKAPKMQRPGDPSGPLVNGGFGRSEAG